MPSAEARQAPRAGVRLAPLTTLRVGGAAEWFLTARSAADVAEAHAWAGERGLPMLVLGGGSNLVVADAGVRGLVVHVAIPGLEVRSSGDEAILEAGAGERWDGVVARAVEENYAGVEMLSGIPGLVGGTPIQNVGAYGQEVADTIERVTVFDSQSGALAQLSARDCGFSYRQSRFKGADAGRFVVCQVAFRLRRGGPTLTYPDVVAWAESQGLRQPTLAAVRGGVLEIRRRKGMVLDEADPDTRSVGSFFMNPIVTPAKRDEIGAPSFPVRDGAVKIPAAWLIERAGFPKGYQAGAAGLSSKHPLALVTRAGGTADAVVALASLIKRAVLDRFGIALRPEPVFAGFDGDERISFLQGHSA